jgi:hypothetical protein
MACRVGAERQEGAVRLHHASNESQKLLAAVAQSRMRNYVTLLARGNAAVRWHGLKEFFRGADKDLPWFGEAGW